MKLTGVLNSHFFLSFSPVNCCDLLLWTCFLCWTHVYRSEDRQPILNEPELKFLRSKSISSTSTLERITNACTLDITCHSLVLPLSPTVIQLLPRQPAIAQPLLPQDTIVGCAFVHIKFNSQPFQSLQVGNFFLKKYLQKTPNNLKWLSSVFLSSFLTFFALITTRLHPLPPTRSAA